MPRTIKIIFLLVLFFFTYNFNLYSQTVEAKGYKENQPTPILINKIYLPKLAQVFNLTQDEIKKNEVNDGYLHLFLNEKQLDLIKNFTTEFKVLKYATPAPSNELLNNILQKNLAGGSPYFILTYAGDESKWETLTIYMDGRNNGATTNDEGYMTLSFPEFSDIYDYGRDWTDLFTLDNLTKYKQGTTIGSCSGSSIIASYVVVDGYENGWSSNESHKMWVKVTPYKAGKLNIYGKMSIGNVRYPSGGCGGVDQQKWPVNEYYITIPSNAAVQVAKWQNSSGTDITQADACSSVRLYISTTGYASGTQFTAKIYEYDGISANDYQNQDQTITINSSGYGYATWAPSWVVDNAANPSDIENVKTEVNGTQDLTDPNVQYIFEVYLKGTTTPELKESNKLNVFDNTNPPQITLSSPANNTQYQVLAGNTQSIAFSWNTPTESSCQSSIDKYRIEVSKNTSFSNLEWSDETSSTQITHSFGEGTYYWRVVARDKAGNPSSWTNGNWSTTRSFTITGDFPSNIKIIGVTQLAHSDPTKTGIKIVAEIKPIGQGEITGAYLYFTTNATYLSLLFSPLAPLVIFSDFKMTEIAPNLYEFIIDKKVPLPAILGGGLFNFNSKDMVNWKIIAVDNVNGNPTTFPLGSTWEKTQILNYLDLNSNLEINNSLHGFVKPYLSSLTQLKIENNKYFYLGVKKENAVNNAEDNKLSFGTEGLYTFDPLGINVLQSKTIPLGWIWPPTMSINNMDHLAVGDNVRVLFSKTDFWASVATAVDFTFNILDLKPAENKHWTKFVFGLMKLFYQYYNELTTTGVVIDAKDPVKFIEAIVPFAFNKGPGFIEALVKTLSDEGVDNAAGILAGALAKMTPLKIYSQSKSIVNATFTAVDYLTSTTADTLDIKYGNGHFVNIEPINLAGITTSTGTINPLAVNSSQKFQFKVTNTSNQKLYNIWLGFDIYAFDRNKKDYIKVENTKTPIPDNPDYEGTGKIGRIEFTNQGHDLNPGESYTFETLPYTFSKSVTDFQYHSDYIPYKYIFTAWSSGYPGQQTPSAVRLTNINLSMPFFIKDNIAPAAPTIKFDNTVTSNDAVFLTWEINPSDLSDADSLVVYIDGVLNRVVDANVYKMVLIDKSDKQQQVKVKLYDIGGNGSDFSNVLTIPAKTTTVPTIVVSKSSINFGNQLINTASNAQSYSVSGSNLTSDITINVPTGFELSKNNIDWQTTSITFNQSNGTVTEKTIYVRFKPTVEQPYSGNIEHTSSGTTKQYISVSGTGTSSCEPGWTPVSYTNSTTAYGIVTIEGQPATSDDLVGVFAGSECRAVGNINIEQGKAYVTLVIQGDNVETINFKIYDKSNCKILSVNYSTQSKPGGVIGVPPNYLPLDASSSTVTQSLTLKSGWNLVSLNVRPSDMSTTVVFAPVISSLKEVKDLSKTFSPDVPSFLNTLTSMVNGTGYWVRVSTDVILNITGAPVDYQSEPISLLKGWNLVGYTCQNNNEIKTALSSIMYVLEEVKDLSSSYNTSVPEFLNTLTNLVGGSGYWIKVTSDASLTYPQPPNPNAILSKSNKSALTNKTVSNNWKPVIYPNSMVLYSQIIVNDLPIKSGIVGAFVNGECRGIGKIIIHNGISYSTLVINGVTKDRVNFKIIDTVTNEVMSANNDLTLIPGSTHSNILMLKGNTREYLNSLLPKTTYLYPSYPNPFNPSTQIKFDIHKTTNVNLFIYNINGQLVKKVISNEMINPGTYNYTWYGTNSNNDKISSGIYIIQFITNENRLFNKIILLK